MRLKWVCGERLQGIQTHAASGDELSKKARQGAEKEYKKREQEFGKLQEQLAEEPSLISAIEAEIESLRKRLSEL